MLFPFKANHTARMKISADLLLILYMVAAVITVIILGGIYYLISRCNKKAKASNGSGKKPHPFGHSVHPANDNFVPIRPDYDEYSIV